MLTAATSFADQADIPDCGDKKVKDYVLEYISGEFRKIQRDPVHAPNLDVIMPYVLESLSLENATLVERNEEGTKRCTADLEGIKDICLFEDRKMFIFYGMPKVRHIYTIDFQIEEQVALEEGYKVSVLWYDNFGN